MASEDIPGNDPWWFRYFCQKGYRLPPDDDKAALRRLFRARRSRFVETLSPDEREIAFSHLPSPLARLCRPGSVVAGYVSIGSEAEPAKLLAQAEKLGCRIALPHITSRVAPMRFLQWGTSEPLEEGPFGLSQPMANAAEVKPDIVLVPLLAFDSGLMRLGQGAGHYDRALSLLDDAFIVGLGWSVQQAETLPADPWDIPMHAILTEKSWISR